jgi:hypothetical protein
MDKRSSLKNEFQSIVDKYPDATPAMKLLFKLVCDIEELSRFTLAPVGQSEEWTAIVSSAEESSKKHCKSLIGKAMPSALYGAYTVMLNDLKSCPEVETSGRRAKKEDGF